MNPSSPSCANPSTGSSRIGFESGEAQGELEMAIGWSEGVGSSDAGSEASTGSRRATAFLVEGGEAAMVEQPPTVSGQHARRHILELKVLCA